MASIKESEQGDGKDSDQIGEHQDSDDVISPELDVKNYYENAPAGGHASPTVAAKQRHYQNRRADAFVLMANQSLENTSSGSSTADRFQVVVHVDSQVLSEEQPYKTTGGPDCYIEDEVALPLPAARRLRQYGVPTL